MLRSLQLNPQAFLDILHLGGCRFGAKNERLQHVVNPANPGRSTVVRLDMDATHEEIEVHLFNLGVEESEFLGWHERFVALFRN